jgi:hypothetical protein
VEILFAIDIHFLLIFYLHPPHTRTHSSNYVVRTLKISLKVQTSKHSLSFVKIKNHYANPRAKRNEINSWKIHFTHSACRDYDCKNENSIKNVVVKYFFNFLLCREIRGSVVCAMRMEWMLFILRGGIDFCNWDITTRKKWNNNKEITLIPTAICKIDLCKKTAT